VKCDDTGHCGNWPREIDDDSGNLCDATGQINSTLLQVYRSSERSLRTELKNANIDIDRTALTHVTMRRHSLLA